MKRLNNGFSAPNHWCFVKYSAKVRCCYSLLAGGYDGQKRQDSRFLSCWGRAMEMRVKQIWTLHLPNTLNFVQETLLDSNTEYEKRKATFSQVNWNAMTHICTVLQLLEQITPGHPPQQKTGAFHATWLQMIDSSVNNTQGLTWCCKLLVWSTREFFYLGQHLHFFPCV